MTQTHSQLTQNLIKGQLNTCNVLDARVLNAIEHVARERFVPENYRDVAYVDRLLSIESDGVMQEPLVTARMLELAAIEPTDAVVVIGDATGYTSALCAQLAHHVKAVSLAKSAYMRIKSTLTEDELERVSVSHGTVKEQMKSVQADVIIIDGGVQSGIEVILPYLHVTKGRLVTITLTNTRPGCTQGQGLITMYQRTGDNYSKTIHGEAATQLLPEFAAKQSFTL